MTEQEGLLVLNAVPLLGALRIRKLLAKFGNALAVLGAPREALAQCEFLSLATARNIIQFSKDKFLRYEYNLMQRKGISVVTAADGQFPSSLKDFDDAPVVLYVKGEMACLNQKSVAIVGSRSAGFHGRRLAHQFAEAFARAGLQVASGLARGIDTAAHQGCLSAGGKTIAVIGCGFKHMYPKENMALMEKISAQGAVISEFAFDMHPLQHNFPWRNRIISGLSTATLVIEARDKSGALITADFAVAQNKDVFVVPSNIDTETAVGSNRLIQDGARVALNPGDVLEQILGRAPDQPSKDHKPVLLLSEEQSRVYPLINFTPVHLDELSRQTGMNINSLMNITLSLELKRAIRQLPGQYYVRNEYA